MNGVDVFEIFNNFASVAPTHVDELEDFEEDCREKGFVDVADWVALWRQKLEFHIVREWELD